LAGRGLKMVLHHDPEALAASFLGQGRHPSPAATRVERGW
jgi:hypothetical protein